MLVDENNRVLKSSGDLHTHSRYSDGSLDIEYILYLAARRNVGYISITDHEFLHDFDTIKKMAVKYGVVPIFGVELSCIDFKRNRKVHILGYNFKKPEIIKPFCDEILKSKKEASEKVCKLIIKKYDVVPALIERYKSKSGCFFETNILHALAECGYSSSINWDFSSEVFKDEYKINFKHADVWKMLEIIKQAGGKSVLAHPGVYNSFDLLDELVVNKSIDGVEVWHPKNSKAESERLYNIVKTNNLIATGGTDFHGLYSSKTVRIGDYVTPYVYIKRLME